MAKVEPGTKLTENLRLVRKLGQGAMGEVWIAENLTLQSEVAVKLLQERLAESDEMSARFVLEARAVAQIKSPHVVQIFDFGVTAEGTAFIVMELLAGQDLSERVKARGPLSTGDCVAVITQAASALAKAHAATIVHRDIKPANLFLADSDDGAIFLKVLDFGVAKFAATGLDMTATGALVGTPHYMSPEQLLSPRKVDARADLWALSVTAYYCLTGEYPFIADSVVGLANAIRAGKFAPPSARASGVPLTLDDWFVKAFAGDIATRPQTCKELAEGLRIAAQVSTVALPFSAPSTPRVSESGRYDSLSIGGIAETQAPVFTEGAAPPELSVAATQLGLQPTPEGTQSAMMTSAVGPAPSRLTPLVAAVGVLLAGAALWRTFKQPPTDGEPASAARGSAQLSAEVAALPESSGASSAVVVADSASALPVDAGRRVVSAGSTVRDGRGASASTARAAESGDALHDPVENANGMEQGSHCATDLDCVKGFCTDGVCCAERCGAACRGCSRGARGGGALDGYCQPVIGGEDPAGECGAGKKCDGAGKCSDAAANGKGLGNVCTGNSQCGSGNCIDGVCCDSACNSRCYACTPALTHGGSAAGHCAPVVSGRDPRSTEGTCGQ